MNTGALNRLSAWVDRYRWVLASLVVLVYLLAFNNQWRVGSDSAAFLNAARTQFDPATYDLPDTFGLSEISPHQYHGLVNLVAATFHWAGSADLTLIHLLLLAMGLATIALTYRLVRYHESRGAAVVVACLIAVNQTFFELTFQVLSDLPFTFGVMMFLVGWEGLRKHGFVNKGTRRRLGVLLIDAAMLITGLLVLVSMKRTMWTMLAASGATMLWWGFSRFRRRKWTAVFLLGAIVFACALIWFGGRYSDREVGRQFMLHLLDTHSASELLERFVGNFAAIFEGTATEAALGVELAPGLNTMIALTLIVGVLMLTRVQRLWGWWAALSLTAMIVHPPAVRYYASLTPLLAYAWLRNAVWLENRLAMRRRPTAASAAAALMMLLWFAPNTVKMIGTIIEQRRTPFIEHYHHGKYAAVRELAVRIKQHVGPNDLVIAPESSVLAYESGRWVINERHLNRWRRRDSAVYDKLIVQVPAIYIVEPLPELDVPHSIWPYLEPGEVMESVSRPDKAQPYILRRMSLAPTAN